jgi:hypothetical protein
MMQTFFGTAVERRVAQLAGDNNILSALTHTANNAPQDFIGPENFGYDITGSSASSIFLHTARPEVQAVVTYESIPGDFGYQWANWYAGR